MDWYRTPKQLVLLDTFCGAGGCSYGYVQAGFRVVGVDIENQPNYPFDFIKADALTYIAEHGTEYDAVHASPPCHAYTEATAWRRHDHDGDRSRYPRLIRPTQVLLRGNRRPYIIENVPGARRVLRDPFMLCGSALGHPFRRHRYFESNVPCFDTPPKCQHKREHFSFDHGKKQPETVYRDVLGVPWMLVRESRQAIPPIYTRWIGRQLLDVLG
jgi:hypothetical protein